jgi:hypothetical protein
MPVELIACFAQVYTVRGPSRIRSSRVASKDRLRGEIGCAER